MLRDEAAVSVRDECNSQPRFHRGHQAVHTVVFTAILGRTRWSRNQPVTMSQYSGYRLEQLDNHIPANTLRQDPSAYLLSHATTFLATFWPHSTTIGMPPPGLTEPPTKKRFGYRVLCFGALKARFLKRSLTTP